MLPLALSLAVQTLLAGPPVWVDHIADAPDLRGEDTVTVLVFGDAGKASGFTGVAAAAHRACFEQRAAQPCDLAVMVGDNVYEHGIDTPGNRAWADAFVTPMAPFATAANFRVWVTAGNHDWRPGPHRRTGERRIQAAIDTTNTPANKAIHGMWQYPALAYEVPGLPAWLHLYGVDTTTVVREGVRDDEMLDEVRARMRMGEPGEWHVVFGHHAPASSGTHAMADTYENARWAGALETMRDEGLDLVLAGHDHHQELLVSGGIPVVIQGNSSKGRKIHDTAYMECRRWARPGKTAKGDQLGFAIVTFTPQGATLEFFDAAGTRVHEAPLPVNPASDGRAVGWCPPPKR